MIHPQLVQDCHLLGRFEATTLLLHRNALLPWFILVPDTDSTDLLDLPESALQPVLEECQRVSRFIKQELGFTKVNFAGLGNLVPQLHLHVIGRSASDAYWPNPVWGIQVSKQASYQPDQITQWQNQLTAGYGLCATG